MRQLLTISFFLLWNAISAPGQVVARYQVDSMLRLLPTLKDTDRVSCLNALGNGLAGIHPDSSYFFAAKALQEAQSLRFLKGQAHAYRNMALAKTFAGKEFPLIETLAAQAVAGFRQLNDKPRLANAYLILGLAYWAQSKFDPAIRALDNAALLYHQLKDDYRLAEVYVFAGQVEEQRGHYSSSLHYALMWLEVARKHNNQFAIQPLANLYRNAGDYETALSYYRTAIREGNRLKAYRDYDYLMLGELFFLQKKYDSAKYCYNFIIHNTPPNSALSKPYSRLGELYLGLKKYDSALMYLLPALQQFRAENDKNQMMWVLLRLGNTYLQKGQLDQGLQTATSLLRMARQTGARQFKRDAHQMLYQLYEKQGDHLEAYEHLQQYTVLKDSIDRDLAAHKLAFFKIKDETEKAKAWIGILKREKELQQQQLQAAAQQRKYLIISLFALLFIAFIMFRNVLLKRRNEKHRRELAEIELQMQKLESEKKQSALQQQTIELEIKALRAQMNPHFIFNCLNAINHFILKNETETASDYLTKFSRLIRQVLQSTSQKNITLQAELETLRLYIELEQLRFKDHFSYEINLAEGMEPESIAVPPLLLQPFVENAIWHGLMHQQRTGRLVIDLEQQDDNLRCTITDNGIGRKKADELKNKNAHFKESLGMYITASRLKVISQETNGPVSLRIIDLEEEGQPAGTRVIIQMPVKTTETITA